MHKNIWSNVTIVARFLCDSWACMYDSVHNLFFVFYRFMFRFVVLFQVIGWGSCMYFIAECHILDMHIYSVDHNEE